MSSHPQPPLAFGPWHLHERLGWGGTAEVWRATLAADQPALLALGAECVVKRLHPGWRGDTPQRRLLLSEIQVLSEINVLSELHVLSEPGRRDAIAQDSAPWPQLLAHGEVHGLPWFAMPRWPGQTLAAQAAGGRRAPGSDLSWPQARDVFAGLLAALAALHGRGWVHADVAPGNVWLLPDGGVRLLDFSLCSRIGTRSPQHAGTPGMRSPEQEQGLPLQPASDLFSAACLMRQLLGSADVPAAWPPLLAQLLQPDPRRRPQDAWQVRAQLLAMPGQGAASAG